MALPSRPPPRPGSQLAGVSQAPAAFSQPGNALAWALAMLKLPARVAGVQLSLWQVLAPGLLVGLTLLVVLASMLGSAASAPRQPAAAGPVPASAVAAPATPHGKEPVVAGSFEKLEGKAPELLSATELLALAEGRVAREHESAQALRRKLEADPTRALDKATQTELLRLVNDGDTARAALATMVRLPAPINADLLYEVWTGTSVRNDTTELARTLVYSTDVRPQASPALAVALDLRSAESCEQYQAVMPKALKDGDRRALHLLTKLTSKRGCGPKKAADCFACLREHADELTATINAVKSRRPPSYPAP